MDCPRCGLNNGPLFDGRVSDFCFMCGWDLIKEINICDNCGLEAHEQEGCPVCGVEVSGDPTAGWGDWNPPDDDKENKIE